ncbi:MAG: hypothetical protein MJ225_03865 [Bacilli bacterium]|nr:hypothetical protein [Bacilli bacterium]
MREAIRKVYPILIAPLCLIAGVLSFVFFFCGPVGKGNYDILAIGCVAIVLSLIQLTFIIIDIIKERKIK